MPETTLISQEGTRTKKYRTNVSKLGGGYTQRHNDGLNSEIATWTIKWNNLSSTQRDTVWAALDAVGGSDYLTWTAPGDLIQKKWRITGNPTESAISGNLYTISISVEQTFDII